MTGSLKWVRVKPGVYVCPSYGYRIERDESEWCLTWRETNYGYWRILAAAKEYAQEHHDSQMAGR